jgi:hypothetical protein
MHGEANTVAPPLPIENTDEQVPVRFGDFLVARGAVNGVMVELAAFSQDKLRALGQRRIPRIGEMLLWMGALDRAALEGHLHSYGEENPSFLLE